MIDLAFYQGGAEALRLGEEFHHNGLTIRCAQIGRVPRGLAFGWDRQRLARETVAFCAREGGAIREHLITHVVPFDDAPAFLADSGREAARFHPDRLPGGRMIAAAASRPGACCSFSPGWWWAARRPKCACWPATSIRARYRIDVVACFRKPGMPEQTHRQLAALGRRRRHDALSARRFERHGRLPGRKMAGLRSGRRLPERAPTSTRRWSGCRSAGRR